MAQRISDEMLDSMKKGLYNPEYFAEDLAADLRETRERLSKIERDLERIAKGVIAPKTAVQMMIQEHFTEHEAE